MNSPEFSILVHVSMNGCKLFSFCILCYTIVSPNSKPVGLQQPVAISVWVFKATREFYGSEFSGNPESVSFTHVQYGPEFWVIRECEFYGSEFWDIQRVWGLWTWVLRHPESMSFLGLRFETFRESESYGSKFWVIQRVWVLRHPESLGFMGLSFETSREC